MPRRFFACVVVTFLGGVLPLQTRAQVQQAQSCTECHAREGRLSAIQDLYLPRRDRSTWLDVLGWTGVGLTAGAGAVHGGVRIVISRRRRVAGAGDGEI